MSKRPTALLVMAMTVAIIGVDFAFFRHSFWGRLVVNGTIVIISGAIYVVFLRRP